MLDVIIDSIIDSLKLFPFLFGAFFLIEYVEHKASDRFHKILSKQNRFGAVVGALLGVVPQCGFSVAASNLYSCRLITAGTLVSVFISTSDEAIPILISDIGNLKIILELIVVKVIIAIIAGLLLDFIIRYFIRKKPLSETSLETDDLCVRCHCEHGIFKAAFSHTLNIFIYILLLNTLLNVLIYYIGEDNLSIILLSNSVFQPALAALIGFIPNCASSVVLTQLYIAGNISFGSIIAGLSTGAGIGLLVLFKENKNLKENIGIVLFLYIIGALSGTIIHMIG